MKAITVSYNGNSDDTFTNFADQFNDLDEVTKIDIIQDSIKELEELRDELIISLSKKHLKENTQ